MAGPAASLPVPRLQLLYTAIDRMLDHVINTALTDSSTPQKTQHQQRLQHWKQQVMVISAITTLQPGSAAPRFTAAVRPPLSSPPRLRRPVLCYQLEVEAIIDERRLLDLLSQVEQLSLRTSANGDDAQPMSAEPSPSHPPLQLQVTAGQSNSRSPPMFALRLHSPLVSLSAPADELRDEIAALHQRQSKSLQDTADELSAEVSELMEEVARKRAALADSQRRIRQVMDFAQQSRALVENAEQGTSKSESAATR